MRGINSGGGEVGSGFVGVRHSGLVGLQGVAGCQGSGDCSRVV